MKRLILFLLTVIMTAGVMAQTHKVAILETVDRENILSYGIKLMVRSHLAEAVTNTAGYEAYDRTNLQQIFDEQEFQRTGYVSDDDIKRIGEMTGVQYVLVAEASKLDEKNLFITAKILNVETARVEKTANTMSQTDIQSLQKSTQDLASRLLSEIKPAEITTTADTSNEGHYIERISINEYKYGDQWLTKKDCYNIVNNRDKCLPAYLEFQKGLKIAKAGWGLFAIGIACAATGFPILFIGYADFQDGDDDLHTYIRSGLAFAIVGVSSCLTSVPLLSIGYAKQDNAIKIYNEQCAPKKGNAITLNLQSGRDGLGLALCF